MSRDRRSNSKAKGRVVPPPPQTSQPVLPKRPERTEEYYQQQIRLSNWRVRNYLHIHLSVLVVYGLGVVAESLLFSLIWFLMGDDIQKYKVVATAAEYAQIAISLVGVVAALVHAAFATWGQFQLDRKLAREDEDE